MMLVMRASVWGLAGLSVLVCASAQARNFRVDQIPNNNWVCRSCHVSDGGSRNGFGADVEQLLNGQDADWSVLYNLDSDNDGFTNGEELGDPMGLWRTGDEQPIGDVITNPGDPNDFPIDPDACGNGVLDRGEECDGDNLGDASCQGAGFDAGQVVCNDQCRLDTTGCTACGDNTINGDEVCDGDDLGGATCVSEGFDGGQLNCNNQCGLDTTGCTVCGNDALEADEQCDGADLGGETCESRGFLSGALACSPGCTFDEGACQEDPGNVCGDGRRRNGEACDGPELGDATCEILGFDGGELTCNDVCELDVSGCFREPDPVNNDPGNNDPGNNDPGNNDVNNDGNNDTPNNDPGDGGANQDDQAVAASGGGCAVATIPKAADAGLWGMLLMGLVALWRRRRRR